MAAIEDTQTYLRSLQVVDFEHAEEADTLFLDLSACDDDELAYLGPELLNGNMVTKARLAPQSACCSIGLLCGFML